MKKDKPQTGEERFLEKLADSFSEQYPNAERVGCVGKDLLWKMALRPKAFRRDPRAEATLKHLAECAPCLDELGELRTKAVLVRRCWMLAGIFLAVLLVLAVRFIRP